MANHLENLITQFYDWQGWIVRNNVRVGRLAAGGYAGELDVVAYNPASHEVIHFEPSLDGDAWDYRQTRYEKKFKVGREYIKEVFPWLPPDCKIRQFAIFNNVPSNRREFAGAEAKSIEDLVKEMTEKIRCEGYVGVKAIPEKYDLLRTIQLVLCGYYTDPK